MQNDSAEENELTMRLTKAGQDYEIRISREDEDLFRLYKWSLLIGRNGHLYLHRTEKRKKIYFSRSVLERELAQAEGKETRPLVKGESCIHLDSNSANKTRGNLALKVSKALQAQRSRL
jgi:hypothetical protein